MYFCWVGAMYDGKIEHRAFSSIKHAKTNSASHNIEILTRPLPTSEDAPAKNADNLFAMHELAPLMLRNALQRQTLLHSQCTVEGPSGHPSAKSLTCSDYMQLQSTSTKAARSHIAKSPSQHRSSMAGSTGGAQSETNSTNRDAAALQGYAPHIEDLPWDRSISDG